MKAIFALAAALLPFASAGIVDCGVSPLFKITKLAQIPDTNVKPGDNTTLILNYDVPSVISGGKATTSLSINGIPFSPSVEDLCTKVACPIEPGSHDGSSWTTFPSGVNGKIVSKVAWTDTTGKELLCIKSTFVASEYTTGPIDLFSGRFSIHSPKRVRGYWSGYSSDPSSSGTSDGGSSHSSGIPSTATDGTGTPSTGSSTHQPNSTSLIRPRAFKKLRGYQGFQNYQPARAD